jgi:hypothetical protein
MSGTADIPQAKRTQAIRPRGRPPTGSAQSPAQRMRRYRERQRAAGLRAVTRMEAPVRTLSGGALKHRIIEARSLAMHCLAAQKIMLDLALLDRVRRTLDAWRVRYGKDAPRALDEWAAILRRPWPQIAAFITDPGERATRLRQSTPFAGVLGVRERERMYAAFRP